jgi:hypothetical protein
MQRQTKIFVFAASAVLVFGVLVWGATHFEQVKASISGTYFDFGGKRLTNAALPLAAGDVATRAYVLSAAAGPAYIVTTREQEYNVDPNNGGSSCNGDSYNFPAAYCPAGWAVQTSWTYQHSLSLAPVLYGGNSPVGCVTQTLCSK